MTSIPIWIAWLKYLSFVYYGTPTHNRACTPQVPHAPERHAAGRYAAVPLLEETVILFVTLPGGADSLG